MKDIENELNEKNESFNKLFDKNNEYEKEICNLKQNIDLINKDNKKDKIINDLKKEIEKLNKDIDNCII